jgi:hypothetical protein
MKFSVDGLEGELAGCAPPQVEQLQGPEHGRGSLRAAHGIFKLGLDGIVIDIAAAIESTEKVTTIRHNVDTFEKLRERRIDPRLGDGTGIGHGMAPLFLR